MFRLKLLTIKNWTCHIRVRTVDIISAAISAKGHRSKFLEHQAISSLYQPLHRTSLLVSSSDCFLDFFLIQTQVFQPLESRCGKSTFQIELLLGHQLPMWRTWSTPVREACLCQNGWIFGKFPKGGGSISIQKISLQFFFALEKAILLMNFRKKLRKGGGTFLIWKISLQI